MLTRELWTEMDPGLGCSSVLIPSLDNSFTLPLLSCDYFPFPDITYSSVNSICPFDVGRYSKFLLMHQAGHFVSECPLRAIPVLMSIPLNMLQSL